MAMQVETPSRIWRRIKEAEARDDDMPSLPSLPGLDDSSASDLDPSSSFDNDVATGKKPSFDTVQSSVPLLHTRGGLSRKEPSGPSEFSIRQDVEKENDGHAQYPSSHKSSGITESTRANHVPDPKKEIAVAGYPHVARHPASDGRSSTALAQPRNALKSVDTNLLPTDMSRAIQASSNDYSSSDVPNLLPFEDITVQKPSRTSRQPYTAVSLPSSCLSIPSLPSISITHSSVWAEEDYEATERGLETVTIQPLVGTEGERLRHDYIDGSSGAEIVKIIEETEISRDPTFSSEGAEATRRTTFQNPKFVALPAGLRIPAQAVQAESGIQGYAPHEENHDEADDLETPLPRRKSFLLSVVNSTVRPRMTAPSPHSRAHPQKVVARGAAVTPGPSRLLNTGTRRVRLSRPLAQVSELRPSPPLEAFEENHDKLEGATGSSFVSTASSHDLTLHHRVNASFDPLTGPQGVSRFNASKLNSYLHGLNRRLQEENEVLVLKIRSQQAELEMFHDQTRRRELSGVVEDLAAEQWVLEKEALEQKVAEFEKRIEAKDEELAESQAQRMRDRERWKERIQEVEAGVGKIIADLERRVEEAEARAALLNVVEEQLRDVQAEVVSIKAEDERCRDTSKSIVGVELEDVMRQLEEKENELSCMRDSLAEREREASTLQNIIRDLESSLRATRGSIESSQDARELRKEQRELKDELRDAQATVDKFKSESSLAIDKVKELERQLAETRESFVEKGEAVELANERALVASEELEKARASIQQLEAALEESDKKILADDSELIVLRSKLSVMKRESEAARTADPMKGEISDGRADLEALEAELADAMKEIGRLNSLIDRNPTRRALDKARESRIDLLKKENQELLEQLRAVREPTFLATPLRNTTMSGISPMHRRLLNLTLRTPRTPGEPLKNASWLMNATGEITTNHLVDEIDRLQRELDLANDSIDDKLDKLEEAGLGVVGLTKALEDARRRITDLERQLEEGEMRMPSGDLCAHCGSGENDGATRLNSNSTLQLRLAMVSAELEALRKQRDEELINSSGEKAVLRDATNRLNFEIKRAKEELRVAKEKGHKAEKSKAELQQELASARKTIDDLEHFLQSKRSRLRIVGIENSNATKEKDRIIEKLKETEQKMEMTKDRLFKLKETNIRLESELKAERKTAHIEETLIGNRETIDQLRQERSQLSEKYYDLQQLLAEASKNASSLATRHAKLQSTYDSHRRQLDRQAEEIEKLRAALLSQRQTPDVGWSNKSAHADDEELTSLASRLQSELSRIQEEANKFGRDLIFLKAERDQLVNRHHEELEQHELETKQIRAQLRCLKQQLASRKESKDLATEIQNATAALRLRHNRECKGLFVQIHYLKAKFTREAALRDDLGYQKSYLLLLLSRYEKSEKRILATIAAIGPIQTLTRPVLRQLLRKAALAIVFINRARRASEAWRAQRSACAAVSAALDNIRKNRA